MRRIYAIGMLLVFAATARSQNKLYAVNAVIGDESYVQIFGSNPNELTNEVLRIQTHLLFVEKKLRSETPKGLTKKQRKRREVVLNHLHEYLLKGIFPSNYDYLQERKPCFIDRHGKICAVGYLIEKTAGLKAAEKINSLHQYDYIMDMNEEMIENWARENSFTLEECAMIQPAYGGMPTDKTIDAPIKTSYGISSGLVGGSNIAVTILNLSKINSGGSKVISKIGLVSGTTQLILGLANIRKDHVDYMINGYSTKTSYSAQNNLSYINIASGAATLVTSSLNLLLNKNKKEVKNNITFYSSPATNQKMNMGLSLIRRI